LNIEILGLGFVWNLVLEIWDFEAPPLRPTYNPLV
jgi:hypothetical protein